MILMNVIETENLTKKFEELTAVNGVSLNVKEGEIFGLLGPNGAGKTTLISMLVTMKRPTSGSARVNGFDVVSQPGDVRRSIGIVFQDPSLDEELSAYENLDLHAAMYGVEKAARRARIMEVLEMVELKDRMEDLVKTYSGGMRRRLEIARALVHYPKMLFLDEPTIGLDPQTRKHVWDYVKKLKEEHGISILLTTHYMDEADGMCDRIAIVDHGNIIALGTSTELKGSLGGDKIVVEGSNLERLAPKLKDGGFVKDSKLAGGKLTITVENGEKRIPEIAKIAAENGITMDAINLRKPTLDDVFMHYTGREMRQEEASGKESMRIHRRAWGGRK